MGMLVIRAWLIHYRIRVGQTISRRHPNCEALLCFVAKVSVTEP
jgi:hypothetical protein